MSDAIPESELARLLEGREKWCPRDDCKVSFVGPLRNAEQWICDTCLTIWGVRLTALGPAWWQIGTTAPTTKAQQ